MAFIGSTTEYPTVTPAAADLVPIVQASTGEMRTALVSGLTGTAAEPVVALTGTSHSILASYRSKLVTFSNAAAVAVSLPQAGVTFPDGWFSDVKNIGAGTVTITPTTSTIDGAATLVLTTGKSCRIVSDGTNYRTIFITGTVDADDVAYTPTTLADWDGGADPGDVAPALDQLAERVTDLEAGGGSGTVTSVDASGGVQTASGSAITTTGTIRAANVVNAQSGTSYAVVAGDRGKRVTFSNASSIAATIAQAGTAGFEDGYFVYLENIGAGAVTLTPATSTVNGAATLVLQSGYGAILWSDGANYSALVIGRAGPAVNPQTGTTYTYLSGDRGKLVTHTNAAAIAGTLPQATGAFGSSWFMWVQNRGAGTLTITPTTSTVDGAASLALTTNQGCLIVSDGTNYFTMRGVGGSGGGLTNWTDAVNTSAPNATVPVSSLTATNAASNVDAALVAKGTGATLAQVPDSATAGGNKRGARATDWQKQRVAATQVASGANATIGGGENNTASAAHATVAGGTTNEATAARASIGGGTGNNNAATDATIGGGESNSINASGLYAVIGGGRSNQANAQEATVVGGRANVASGLYAVASGFTSSVTAEGGQAHGRNLTVDGQYSHGRGRRVNVQGMKGVDAWASGSASDSAFNLSQRYTLVVRARTTDATATQATSDGAAASSDNRPALSNSLGASAIFVRGRVLACGTANNVTDVKSWEFTATLRRGTSGNCALVNAVTPTVVDAGSTAGAWTISVTADTGNQCLAIQVTGEAAKTINWAADLDVVHCSA